MSQPVENEIPRTVANITRTFLLLAQARRSKRFPIQPILRDQDLARTKGTLPDFHYSVGFPAPHTNELLAGLITG